MKRFTKRQTRPHVRWGLGRAGLIAAAIVVLAGGAVFAVLQSRQVLLTQNSVSTPKADLGISKDNTIFTSSQIGFAFANIIPGGPAVPEAGQRFYLKNTGAAPLLIKMAVSTEPTNPNNVKLDKVKVVLTTVGGVPQQTFSLQSLIAAAPNGGGIDINAANLMQPGATGTYGLQISMEADAMTGDSATLGNIDFIFTGYVPAN